MTLSTHWRPPLVLAAAHLRNTGNYRDSGMTATGEYRAVASLPLPLQLFLTVRDTSLPNTFRSSSVCRISNSRCRTENNRPPIPLDAVVKPFVPPLILLVTRSTSAP